LESLHAESWGWALLARDRDLAEDVLHGIPSHRPGRARFGGKSSFKTWIFGVIRDRTVEKAAWLWNIRHRRSDAADVPIRRVAPTRTSKTPGGDVGAAMLACRIVSAKSCSWLYHDLTIEDAARVMEVSVGSARTHYDRGKKALARLLTAEETR
jgi:RNA polymerase sigma-70 factor (ECF subfamily)